jgi:hypothetical protein
MIKYQRTNNPINGQLKEQFSKGEYIYIIYIYLLYIYIYNNNIIIYIYYIYNPHLNTRPEKI